MSSEIKISKLNHGAYALNYHLVIVTKYRKRCLTAAMLEQFRAIAIARCEGWGGELIEVNGEPDHIHLLISLPPSLNLSDFVNNLKTTSSRLLRRDFAEILDKVYWKPVLWSRSYFIASADGAPLAVIKQYVEQQAGFDEDEKEPTARTRKPAAEKIEKIRKRRLSPPTKPKKL